MRHAWSMDGCYAWQPAGAGDGERQAERVRASGGRHLRALGPGAVAVAGGHVAVAGALVLVARGAGRHAVAAGAADPAVLEAVVVPARLGAPHPALAVAERCTNKSKGRRRRRRRRSSIGQLGRTCE